MKKITIRQKPGSEGRPMSGPTCEVLMDGVLVPGLTKIKFECEATTVAKVTMELVAEVNIEGNALIEEEEVEYEWEESEETEEESSHDEGEFEE